jgi:hypothetical protein
MAPCITTLKTELSDDPLDRGYAAMNSTEAAASINSVDRSRLRILGSHDLREWAVEDGRGLRILEAITDAELPASVRNVCYIAEKMIASENTSLNVADPKHSAMLVALVTAGVLTSAEQTALVDAATEPISRATELGLGRVGVGNVEQARI